jgi:hypothetical protein
MTQLGRKSTANSSCRWPRSTTGSRSRRQPAPQHPPATSQQEPLTSWGVLIAEGAGQMERAPWLLIFPATFLAITLFCFNFIGDGLRDALDPRQR